MHVLAGVSGAVSPPLRACRRDQSPPRRRYNCEVHDLEELATLAIDLARDVGAILLEGRRRGFGAVSTNSNDSDIVTEIDTAAEQHIASVLRSRRADDAIVGEEGTNDEGTSGVRWIVDPLDGTVNYTYDLPAFAVSIAVEVGGTRSIGVVYNPVLDELFTAVRGEGAYLNGVAISVSDRSELGLALVGTGFAYSAERRSEQARLLTSVLPQVRDIRRMGSAALDLCAVACGRLDAYYEFNVNPWDVAAGDVIAAEAGAIVRSIEGDVAEQSVVAARPPLLEPLLSLVAPQL